MQPSPICKCTVLITLIALLLYVTIVSALVTGVPHSVSTNWRSRIPRSASDHSDFDGLIEYVKQSKAKQVITDNYRSHGAVLAKEIIKRLGVSAVPMPKGKGQTTL